jgi:hypothetical protein
MKRMTAIAIAWPALVMSALAAPARLPYEPPPPQPRVVDLRGTTWSGWNSIVNSDWTVTFEPDGVFYYQHGGSKNRTGHWKQDGDRVYYEVNGKYCECLGTITGNVIQAESWNIKGVRWKIVLQREI